MFLTAEERGKCWEIQIAVHIILFASQFGESYCFLVNESERL